MASFIFAPYFLVKNDTMINFIPLPSMEVVMNSGILMTKTPDAMAVILYGIGVMAAINKIQN